MSSLPTRVVGLVGDLMDRSRLAGAVPGVAFVIDAAACSNADVVVVDLGRFGAAIATLRSVAPRARIVAFGSHVDRDAAARAEHDGADVVLPRSRFFRDPGGAIASYTGGQGTE